MFSTRLFFLCLSMCTAFAIHPYVYQTMMLRKWDERFNHYRYILTYSDCHIDIWREDSTRCCQYEVGAGQFDTLLHALDRLPRDNVCCIVEDVAGESAGFLGGSYRLLRADGFNAYNAEWRFDFSRFMSVARAIYEDSVQPSNQALLYQKPLKDYVALFARHYHLNFDRLVGEVYETIEEIELYDDTAALNTWYRQQIVHSWVSIQKLLDNYMRWCLEQGPYKYRTFLDYLSHGYADVLNIYTDTVFRLVDCKVMHHLAYSPEQIAVLLMGGDHIDNIVLQLRALGWEVVDGKRGDYIAGNEQDKQDPLKRFYTPAIEPISTSGILRSLRYDFGESSRHKNMRLTQDIVQRNKPLSFVLRAYMVLGAGYIAALAGPSFLRWIAN